MTHTMVLSPTVATRVFSLRSSAFDRSSIIWFFVNCIGGTPTRYRRHIVDNLHDFEAPLSMLLREPHLSKMIGITCRNLENTLPQLVSFAGRPIDQYSWERRAGVERQINADGALSVEASLLYESPTYFYGPVQADYEQTSNLGLRWNIRRPVYIRH